MNEIAIQDRYPDYFMHCHGCGRSSESGLRLKSFWHGNEARAQFRPDAAHIGFTGFVYGGLIASLIDCHAMATACAAAYEAAGREIGSQPDLGFVTASLRVNFLQPTPIDATLELVGRARETGARKVLVDVTVHAGDKQTASGEVVAVLIPDSMRTA